MRPLDLVKAQRTRQRVKDLIRDVGLASLFKAPVVVRAQAGKDGQLLATQTRHAPRARERVDARLWGVFSDRHAALTVRDSRHEDHARELLGGTRTVITFDRWWVYNHLPLARRQIC